CQTLVTTSMSPPPPMAYPVQPSRSASRIAIHAPPSWTPWPSRCHGGESTTPFAVAPPTTISSFSTLTQLASSRPAVPARVQASSLPPSEKRTTIASAGPRTVPCAAPVDPGVVDEAEVPTQYTAVELAA